MKKNMAVLIVLMILAFAYTYYTDRNDVKSTAQPMAEPVSDSAQPAPNFSFTDMVGQKYSLEDFRGKAVILNFWASWCTPCVIEFPQMLKLAMMTEKNSVFIFLSEDETPQDIERFIKKYAKNMPQKNVIVAWDKDKVISQSLYQTYRLPETYLINSGGLIAEKIIGAEVEWVSQDMQNKITGLRQ